MVRWLGSVYQSFQICTRSSVILNFHSEVDRLFEGSEIDGDEGIMSCGRIAIQSDIHLGPSVTIRKRDPRTHDKRPKLYPIRLQDLDVENVIMVVLLQRCILMDFSGDIDGRRGVGVEISRHCDLQSPSGGERSV